MQTITKEQAIDLWLKFIDSPMVRQSTNGYGPGGYMQFILSIENTGKKIADLTLITNGVSEIKEKTLKELCTPYGAFTLTIDEANQCRQAWEARDKKQIEYNELLAIVSQQ